MYLDFLLREGGWVPLLDAYHRRGFRTQKNLCAHDGPPWPRIRVIGEFIICTQCLRMPPIQADLLREVVDIATVTVREYILADPEFTDFLASLPADSEFQLPAAKQNNSKPKTELEHLRSKRNKMAKQVNEQIKGCLSFNYRYKIQEVGALQVELLGKSKSTSWVQHAAGRLFQDSQMVRHGLSRGNLIKLQESLPNHQFTKLYEFEEIVLLYEIYEWPESVIELLSNFSNKKSIRNFEHEVHEIFSLRNSLIDSLHATRGHYDATKSRGFKQFDWITPPEDWRTD